MVYQLIIIDPKGVKRYVNVANSEEEFRNTTVEELKRKIVKDICKDYDWKSNT